MERSKIEQFMLLNAGNFSESDLSKIQNKLESVPEEYATLVLGTEFKKPTTALIISFLGGGLGIDRFYLGQTGKGILKLITCGGFGIWSIIDLFIIMGAAREYNTNKLINVINQFISKKKSEKVVTPTTTSNEAYQPKIASTASSDEAYQPKAESTASSDEAYQPKAEPTASSDEAYQPKAEPTASSDEAYQPKAEQASSDEASQTIEEPKLNGDETSASN